MGKLRNKFFGFFYGRYGNDKLNYFLIAIMFIFSVTDILTQWLLSDGIFKTVFGLCMSLGSSAVFVWAFCRMMSRNRYKRMKENTRFLKIVGAVRRFFTFNTSKKTKSHNKDDEFFIFRDCTKCRATLRLPLKKGRNRVKCPRCTHSFYVK